MKKSIKYYNYNKERYFQAVYFKRYYKTVREIDNKKNGEKDFNKIVKNLLNLENQLFLEKLPLKIFYSYYQWIYIIFLVDIYLYTLLYY